MTDDLGPGEYSSYDDQQGLGNESRIPTPHVNKLAAAGMLFINAHSATSLCAPTRASILAGAHQWQTGLEWGIGPATLREGQMSVGDLMQNAGYRTAILGKGHFGGQMYQVDSDQRVEGDRHNLDNLDQIDFDRPLFGGMKQHGFDYVLTLIGGIQAGPYVYYENDLPADVAADGTVDRITNANKAERMRHWPNIWGQGATAIIRPGLGSKQWNTEEVPMATTQKAIDFMRNSVEEFANQPFYVHFNSVCGHSPYVAPDTFRVDVNGDGDTEDEGESYEIDGYNGTGPAQDGLGTHSMRMPNVSDAELGAMISFLEQTDDPRHEGQKLIDNTVVIFTSDNGGIDYGWSEEKTEEDDDLEKPTYGHDSTAGLRDKKGSPWEGGHRVPFIVRWDGRVPAGEIREQQVSNIDLMGTLAGITGQEMTDQGPASFNLLPVLLGERGDDDPVRPFLIAEHLGSASSNVRGNIFIKDGWKIIATNRGGEDPKIIHAFNLDADPAEEKGLLGGDDPQVMAKLNSLLEEYTTLRQSDRQAPEIVAE